MGVPAAGLVLPGGLQLDSGLPNRSGSSQESLVISSLFCLNHPGQVSL